ncbi:siderophore-interacting protein [Aeromicrobium fastidiosum]|uniref:Siderophore-interacting protein n=1 Tax=Aeromicrobium fastidiosum TaxID=52699 RepID=A0A641AQG1_9ACTN|nr:siderophore-interacting protein [Aeromicrobium fastidiosum]KAA1380330.1 siderophore-interacting protein [Aeromicrobium fastidiosum]MBP2389891.1 NADPH-dependent ferric siderophore reductase [Aeromicrobium fastidiosum]
MKTYTATVLGKRQLSAHLVTVTLGGLHDYATTGVPDEYIRLLIPPVGAELALPEIDEKWAITYPEGAVEPDFRVYTISDHRVVEGVTQIDLDIALHDEGVGSDWVRRCQRGEQVGLIEPHGLYAAPADVAWQLLVADITGLPALARILRGLSAGQKVVAHVVLTDPADEIPLPSAADVDVTWQVVAKDTDICEALADAVTSRELPASDRYVWLAGEARASRAARRHLRRELKWPQSDFYTCGYWQIEAEKWNARYEEVAAVVEQKSAEVQQQVGDDQGAYLDALDDIYESVGL